MLSDSVAPLVKTISFPVAPMASPIMFLAFETPSQQSNQGMIPASRIAIDFSKKWQHRLHDPRVRWSRCVVIKINGLFHDVFFLRPDFQNRIH